jgi:hypothetical protein
MKMLLSKVRRIISSFWSKRPQVDYLECHYELLDAEVDKLNEEELGRLIAERDKLKRQKKKWSHKQREIELLKAKQIMNHMRAS